MDTCKAKGVERKRKGHRKVLFLYANKEAPRRISRLLKVAATYSPTIYRSAVPSAMLSLSAALAPLRSAALRLSRPPRAVGAHSPHPAWLPPRAHRRPPRASDALREGYGATHSWDIKDLVSLKKVSLSFSSDHWAHEVIVELVASWEV